MSWVNVGMAGVSLVAGQQQASSARRSARQGSALSAQQRQQIMSFMPTSGNSVQVGSNGSPSSSFIFGGTDPNQGGQFLFNGPNGAGNIASLGTATQGTTSTGGTYRDPVTGVIFDGLTGEAVQGTQVAPGQTYLDLEVPEFSANMTHIGSSADRLLGINEDLGALGQQFADSSGMTSEQLLEISGQAGELLPRVAAGASEMRDSRRAAIENSRMSTMSDLRDSMNRRRIAGSSFADDTLSRAEAEFAQRRGDSDAMSTLEEVTATAQILGFQSQVINQSGQTLLAGLQGQLGALAEQGANERSIMQGSIAGAQMELQASMASFNAQIQAMTIAFQGQEQAQSYIVQLLQLANGATDSAVNALTNQASLSAGQSNGYLSAGANALAGLGGIGGSGGGTTSSGGMGAATPGGT